MLLCILIIEKRIFLMWSQIFARIINLIKLTVLVVPC